MGILKTLFHCIFWLAWFLIRSMKSFLIFKLFVGEVSFSLAAYGFPFPWVFSNWIMMLLCLLCLGFVKRLESEFIVFIKLGRFQPLFLQILFFSLVFPPCPLFFILSFGFCCYVFKCTYLFLCSIVSLLFSEIFPILYFSSL